MHDRLGISFLKAFIHYRRYWLAGLALYLALLGGCSDTRYERLNISTSTWIGYSPLYYAYQKGWLEPLNIKLLQVVSLGENKNLYLSQRSDAFVGTQYEYQTVKTFKPSLKALTFFDRSNGGDMILSNRALAELKGAKKIDVYLESDTVNLILLQDFLTMSGLNPLQIKIINKDQAFIETLTPTQLEHPTLFVTYAPFNVALEKSGFQELASTRHGLDLFVVDGLFATEAIIQKHDTQFKALDHLIARAIRQLNAHPKEYYETVRPYLSNVSYAEFLELKKGIIWLHRTQDAQVLNRIRQYGIEVYRFHYDAIH